MFIPHFVHSFIHQWQEMVLSQFRPASESQSSVSPGRLRWKHRSCTDALRNWGRAHQVELFPGLAGSQRGPEAPGSNPHPDVLGEDGRHTDLGDNIPPASSHPTTHCRPQYSVLSIDFWGHGGRQKL